MKRRGIQVVVALAVVVFLLNLPRSWSRVLADGIGNSLAPLRECVASAVRHGREAAESVRSGRAHGKEREELLTRVALLEGQLHQFRSLQKENAALQAQLKTTARPGTTLVFCEVVGRGDTTGWWQSVTLDKGARDGIGPGMAVVGPRGLVGRTSKVLWSSAEVILITDPKCKVPCRTAGGTDFGILEGMGLSVAGRGKMEMLSAVNPVRMDYVPLEMPLQPGDVVETSGLGGILPAGIAVGRVMNAEMDQSGLYQHAEVAPFSDLSALRYAFVLAPAGKANAGDVER